MHDRFTKLAIVLTVSLGLAIQVSAVDIDDFEARAYTDAAGNTLLYRLFVPRGYDAKQQYPLVLFMHGAGERGSDNRAQISIRSTRVWAEESTQALFPNFMLAPQVPSNQQWVNVPFSIGTHEQPAEPSEPMRLTVELLSTLLQEFSIDPQRLYITGLSMGGYGTWDAITRYPGLFAAAIPICGGGDPTTAPLILGLPLWAFHGDMDPTVPVRGTRHMIGALRHLGGEPYYTEYAGAGHNVWDRAYAEPDLVPWVFTQARP